MAAESGSIEVQAFVDVNDRPSLLGSTTQYPDFLFDEFSAVPTSQNLAFRMDTGEGRSVLASSASSVGGKGEANKLFPDPGMSWAESSFSTFDDSNDSSEAVLKYINQILIEEDMEETPWFFPDQDALLSTEKSLYDALGAEYPRSQAQSSEVDAGRMLERPNGDDRSCWVRSNSISYGNSAGGLDLDPTFPRDGEIAPCMLGGDDGGGGDSSLRSEVSKLSVADIFRDRDSVAQFRKGLEEASKFLPDNTQLFKSINSMNFVHGDESSVVSKAPRTHARDEKWMEEGRAKKQTAVSSDESELTEIFDRVLLYKPEEEPCDDHLKETHSSEDSPPRGRMHRGGKKHNNRKKTVDLRALLVLCAQAVSGHDSRTANELLMKIRENSAPLGDGSQRLAHYFADALEARMAGNGGQVASFFVSPTFKKTAAAAMLKAYHAILMACPFLKFSIYFGGYMINKQAANTEALHIIDFGIGFGFHWPILIQKLSERRGGPPRLRMTGIEFPVPGFRPAQRIEDTFRRLAKYCERFGVPFECAAIPSADWSSIRIADLKLRNDETLAVCSIDRLKNLLDETLEEDNSQRDAVLDLIRSVNPDIFVHSMTCGSYTAPFFVTRFRELLFHKSAMFDMLDTTMAGDSREREVIERELLGREIMNVVACEGVERVERPETHKQWQARCVRAGFRAVPLDGELMKGMRSRMGALYHKDFAMDEDRDSMLLGWRGRIMSSSSCWVPA